MSSWLFFFIIHFYSRPDKKILDLAYPWELAVRFETIIFNFKITFGMVQFSIASYYKRSGNWTLEYELKHWFLFDRMLKYNNYHYPISIFC